MLDYPLIVLISPPKLPSSEVDDQILVSADETPLFVEVQKALQGKPRKLGGCSET